MNTKVYHCSSIDVACLLDKLNDEGKEYLVEKYIMYASTGKLEQELKRRKETI